jgi:beta-mannosidase
VSLQSVGTTVRTRPSSITRILSLGANVFKSSISNTDFTIRFVNEFGFHSMPSVYSWADVLEAPGDYDFMGKVVLSRTRHPPPGSLDWPNSAAPSGQGQMSGAVELWLPEPKLTDQKKQFTQMCWSTQIFQSMIMISEVAFYRRGAGRGENNLGALVWQLVGLPGGSQVSTC